MTRSPDTRSSARRFRLAAAAVAVAAVAVAAGMVVPAVLSTTDGTKSGATSEEPGQQQVSPEGLVTGSATINPDVVACEGCWTPGVDTSWDWVLTHVPTAPFREVDMYDIDGFEATTDDVAALHNAGITAVCYLSAGTAEDWRPDYDSYPAAIQGDEMPEWPGEYWLDVTDVQEPDSALAAIINTRLQMCADKGFDAVEWDNVDAAFNDQETGLSPLPSPNDQLIFNQFLFNNTHAMGMSVLLKNDPQQVEQLVAYADGTVNEQCHEYNECDDLAPFIDAGKPVFNAEYWPSNDFCADAVAARISAINFTDTNLDDSDYYACK